MEIRTEPRPTCLICGSRGAELHSNLKDRLFGVPGNWSLKQCSNSQCGLSWPDPMPSEEDIPLLYKAYYTHAQEGSRQQLIRRLRAFFYGGYMALAYLPSSLAGLRQARQQVSGMFLNGLQPGKLLDVGCGDGGFLHKMHQLGWIASGLDFDEQAIKNARSRYGKSITVMHSDLFHAGFRENEFDALTMNHVIEHVPDPVALLKEVRRVLKIGGRLVVTTPNIRSLGHQLFRESWRGLEVPRHLQIFSRDAIRACAEKAGFEKIDVRTTAANADTIVGASFSLREAKKNGDCASGSRVKINFLRGLRSLWLQYQEAFQLRRDPDCGEELVLICEK